MNGQERIAELEKALRALAEAADRSFMMDIRTRNFSWMEVQPIMDAFDLLDRLEALHTGGEKG